MTIAMPTLQGRWCPSCGSAVGWEDEVCPHCGLPLEGEWGAPLPQKEVPDEPEELTEGSLEELSEEAADTRVIPRIESAIPAERDPQSKVVANEGIVVPASNLGKWKTAVTMVSISGS